MGIAYLLLRVPFRFGAGSRVETKPSLRCAQNARAASDVADSAISPQFRRAWQTRISVASVMSVTVAVAISFPFKGYPYPL